MDYDNEKVRNTAKMREVLEEIANMPQCEDCTGKEDPNCDSCCKEAIFSPYVKSARAALSAQPRNCDRAKDEAEVAWGIEHGRPWNNEEDELAAWLFAPMPKEDAR